MSDDGFDGGTSAHLAFNVFGHPAFLAGGIDLEAVSLRGVVALVSGIDDDARKRCPDLGLDGRNDKRAAVIWFSGQRLDVSDELAAFRSSFLIFPHLIFGSALLAEHKANVKPSYIVIWNRFFEPLWAVHTGRRWRFMMKLIAASAERSDGFAITDARKVICRSASR